MYVILYMHALALPLLLSFLPPPTSRITKKFVEETFFIRPAFANEFGSLTILSSLTIVSYSNVLRICLVDNDICKIVSTINN